MYMSNNRVVFSGGGVLEMEETMHVWAQGIYGKFPYLSINLVVKLFKKNYIEN